MLDVGATDTIEPERFPGSHVYVKAPIADKVVCELAQTVGLAFIIIVGVLLTEIVIIALPLQAPTKPVTV